MKKCNLVVRFDGIQTFRSYVQSKGRARAKPSKFVMMIDNGVEGIKRKANIGRFQQIEKDSIVLCHKEVIDDDEEMDENEIEEYLADPNDPLNSPRVTSMGSVSLVSQYVQKLPSDKFTFLAPFFEFKHLKTCENDPSLQLFRGLGIHASK